MNYKTHHKRLNGVIYTPSPVALEVAETALKYCPNKKPRVLEPSAGDGVFLGALCSLGVAERDITAIDIDQSAIKHLRCQHGSVTAIESDFIRYALEQKNIKFDLIVGNPPYIKRRDYSSNFKVRLKELSQETGFPLSEMKNAWAAFIVGALGIIGDGGILAFVVPYELITVKYGRTIQKYLVQNGFSVDIFLPEAKTFVSIDQDAVVLLGRKTEKGNEEILIHSVPQLCEIKRTQSRTVDQNDAGKAAIDLRSVLFDSETASLLNKLRAKLSTIHDYCDSSAGIVTAANDYFILRSRDTARFELEPWARRILKKSSFLPDSPVFRDQDFTALSESKPCKLIDFYRPLAPSLSSAARKFIQRGESMDIHKRYKCQERKPWYRIPIVPASEGFFFKRAYIFPRLCVNDAKILVTDTAYQIRMKKGFDIRELCYSFYNSITLLFAEIDGRFYGGGVLELTPSEFRGLPLLFQVPSEKEFSEFESAFPKSRSVKDSTFSFGDERVQRKLKMTETEMSRIHNALKKVREHRFRHVRPRKLHD